MYVDPASIGGLEIVAVSSVCGVLLITLGGIVGTVLYFLRKKKKN